MPALLALAAAMVLTGTNVALGKILVEHMPPASFAMLRFVVSSLFLVPLAWIEPGGKTSLMRLTLRQWGEIGLLSLFGVVGFTTLLLIGIQYTSAINVGIITSTLPVVVALLSYFILKEIITPRRTASIALAVLGIMLINLAKAEPSDSGTQSALALTVFGNSFVFAAIVSEAIFVILTRRYAGVIPPWTLTMIVHLLAIPITLPILWWQDGGWILPSAPLSYWLLAGYYIITASILSFYLWCLGIKSVPASTAAIFTALVPISALLVAVFALDESVAMLQIIGLVAVLLSLFIGLAPKAAPSIDPKPDKEAKSGKT